MSRTRMPQQPLADSTDYLPTSVRIAQAPITRLPVNALNDTIDPTLEIRTLIEQLQLAASDEGLSKSATAVLSRRNSG